MRKLVVGAVLAGLAGVAAAGDDLAYVDTSYSAKAFYTLSFGSKMADQTVGLRFGNAAAEKNGAPAFLSANFNGQSSVPTVKLSGIPVYAPRMVNGAVEGGWTLGGLGIAEVAVVGVTVITFGTIVADSVTDDSDKTGTAN